MIKVDIQEIVDINELLNDSTSTVIVKNRLQGILASYHYYETKEHQICSIFKGIIKNHAFIDANKRTGLLFLLLQIDRNNFNYLLSENEMYNLIQEIASTDISVEEISQQLFNIK